MLQKELVNYGESIGKSASKELSEQIIGPMSREEAFYKLRLLLIKSRARNLHVKKGLLLIEIDNLIRKKQAEAINGIK